VRFSRFVCSVLVTAACLFATRPAYAQPAQPEVQETTPVIANEPRWEIEGHGGFSFDREPSGGTATIPTTSSTVQGLASLSTFLFGSGAALFNQIRPATPIVPLDAALGGPAIARGSSYAFGARIFRSLTERFGIEFEGEYLGGQRKFLSGSLTAVEASRASFIGALGGTLPSATVTAVTSITDNQDASRLLATGALVINLKTKGTTIPYVVGGGGIVFNNGTFPSASVTGTYQVGSPSSLYGTDFVSLSYTEDDHAIVYMGGAGIKQQVSKRFGVRADGRVHLYKMSTINLVDVGPAHQVSTVGPPPPIISFGSLQFSTLGPLNGTPYSGVATFTSSGLQAQISITAGVFFRF
jgi:hypothetical protein